MNEIWRFGRHPILSGYSLMERHLVSTQTRKLGGSNPSTRAKNFFKKKIVKNVDKRFWVR